MAPPFPVFSIIPQTGGICTKNFLGLQNIRKKGIPCCANVPPVVKYKLVGFGALVIYGPDPFPRFAAFSD
jgi:hypothetical protein